MRLNVASLSSSSFRVSVNVAVLPSSISTLEALNETVGNGGPAGICTTRGLPGANSTPVEAITTERIISFERSPLSGSSRVMTTSSAASSSPAGTVTWQSVPVTVSQTSPPTDIVQSPPVPYVAEPLPIKFKTTFCVKTSSSRIVMFLTLPSVSLVPADRRTFGTASRSS